jgi:hypothetical protein
MSQTETAKTPAGVINSYARPNAETLLSAIYFTLALVHLAALAGFSHRYTREDVALIEIRLMAGTLIVVWPAFWLEAAVRLHLACIRNQWKQGLLAALLVAVLPPLRLGFRGYFRREELWLPFLGWQRADKELYRRLERAFSVPMIVLALLVLPILVLEFGWEEWRKIYPWFGLTLDVCSAVIWSAFALEFILLISLSENKLQFCVRHWIELLIVVLPLAELLPVLLTDLVPALRLLRILRLQQLGRFGRVYRLRALLTRMWRAFLLLELVQRLTGQTPQKRLRRLRELLAAKLEEVEQLQQEIARLEAQVQQSPNSPDSECTKQRLLSEH